MCQFLSDIIKIFGGIECKCVDGYVIKFVQFLFLLCLLFVEWLDFNIIDKCSELCSICKVFGSSGKYNKENWNKGKGEW